MSAGDWLDLFFNPQLLERYGPRFVDGLLVTGKLVAISFSLGMLLGLVIALSRLSDRRLLRGFSSVYVYFFGDRRCSLNCSCCITASAPSNSSGSR